jgi:acetyl-CoA carboxylase biotin carboxyl carrier protein
MAVVTKPSLQLGKDTAMAQKDSDSHRIEELIEIMRRNDLVEVQIEHGDDKIVLKRSQPQSVLDRAVTAMSATGLVVPARPGEMQMSAAEVHHSDIRHGEELVNIKSPLIGTFYATPSPDSKSYVELGSHVDAQTVVCIIEAMKVMNEIKAETSGTIAEVLAANGQAVEYGQVLFRVKPD